jgi:hypothetical protein
MGSKEGKKVRIVVIVEIEAVADVAERRDGVDKYPAKEVIWSTSGFNYLKHKSGRELFALSKGGGKLAIFG